MAKQATMHFHQRVVDINFGHRFKLGSVEKTNWYLRYDEKMNLFELIRDRDNDKVEIEIDVRLTNSYYLLSHHGQPLLDGQKSLRLESIHKSLLGTAKDTIIEGHVTVRYDPICTLTNKEEEFTEIEKVFTKIADKSFPSPELVNDFYYLLDTIDFFLDTKLVCGSTGIPVHRNILSSKSPVFADMFKTLQECVHGTVDIVDLEPDVLYAMLIYIYSGKTDHYTHLQAGDLLLAAEKFQLEALKLVCVEQLKVNMAANNVFRSLLLGDSHNKSLKEHAVEFICKYKNFSDLEETEDWPALLKKRPSLAMEVTTAIVKYLQNK